MEFGVLGPLRVRDAGVELEIRRGLSRRLLVALLIRTPETVTADALMELLWGADQPRNPANALQIQVSYLRRALSSGPSVTGRAIVTRPGGYAMDVDPDAIDAVRFERLVQQATPARLLASDREAHAALGLLDDALALWRGDALAEVQGEPFANGSIARLEEMRWSAHEQRIDLLLALGRQRQAVGELGALVEEQPLRERLHEQLVLALYRCGRQADALGAYESARTMLVEELGLDPGPALRRLNQDVLTQDPALDWVPLPLSEEGRPEGPRPAEWRRSLVPAAVTSLIGREDERQRVADLVATSRLVTLTGPGGAGKTRLAIDVAGMEEDGVAVWYVDLGAVDLPELVAPTVAAALGATTGPFEEPSEVVAASLAVSEGLLVLDTCEHVLDGAAALVSTVLRRSPSIRVLATSRRPLMVAGETAWPVPPLAVAAPDASSVEEIGMAPAVRLFCERARSVRPDFELDAENASAVASICLTLDGLPLAIELAAARVDVLPPTAILERLHDRFELLVEGAADAAERQQTLRGAIDWSVGLLADDQRAFFARLGAFAGGFDLDAARHVAVDGDDDGLRLLSGLVRHSMVVADGSGRYRLLDTLRAYADELLAALDADATRRRHAEHFTALAEQSEILVRGPKQVEALGRLREEIANLRTALEWSLSVGELDLASRLAGSLAWFWVLDGRLDVADRHLRRAIAIESVPPAVRARTLWGYALLVAGLGSLDEALDTARSSIALARQSGDAAAVGAGLNALAVAQFAVGDLASSAATHDDAIDRFVTAGDLWGEAICRVLRARTAIDRGETDAEGRLRQALEVATRCGDAHVEGIALGLLAQVEAGNGRLPEAIRLAEESLALQESIGYTEGTVASLHVLARLHAQDGDDDAARAVLLRSLRLAWKMQHAAAICEALEGLAGVASRAGDLDAAGALLTVADQERVRRALPVRAADRPRVDALRSSVAPRTGARHGPALAETVAGLLR